MNKCSICESVFLRDLDKMISAGSNNKYVQDWCKERKFKVTIKEIENHQVSHRVPIEKVRTELDKVEKIYLTLSDLEDLLDLPPVALLSYESTNNIRVNNSQTYDVIDIMSHIARELSTEASDLNDRLDEISSDCEKEVIKELKNKKIEAQTRLQTAVASLKEIKLKELQSVLVSNKDLEESWSYSLVGFKAKLESIPNKLALQLSSISNNSTVRDILTKLISESLEELSNGS